MSEVPKPGDRLYRSATPLQRIIAIIDAERADEVEGSDENTEKDCAAYDKIIDLLQEEGLIQ